jgi:hypothetical protein
VTRWRRALFVVAIVWPLVGIAALVILVSGAVLVGGVPKGVTTDRVTAVGTILGAGGFLLAIVATIIAVIAYVNSLPRPDLFVDNVEQVAQAFPPSGTWGLKITLGNRGQVAARFVAVRVTFSNWRWQFTDRTAPSAWTIEDYSTNPSFERASWEGGADAVIHPTWPYTLPELGSLTSSLSFGMGYVANDAGEMVPEVIPPSIDFSIEIVADRMRRPKSFPHDFFIGPQS